MSWLEEVANVVLRVPGIVMLDLLYRWDVENYSTELGHAVYQSFFLYPDYLWTIYSLAHVVCIGLVVLPLRHLVTVYLYLLTALLLYVGHQALREYIRKEMEAGHLGMVYEDQASLTRSASTLTGLVIVGTLCSLLMRTRQAWLFSAPVLPLLGRLAGLPLHTLPHLSALSTGVTLLVMSYLGLSGFRPLCSLFSKAYQLLTQDMELYRLVALVVVVWQQLAIPALFLVFWLALFLHQVYNTLSSKPGILELQGPVIIFLTSVSECCGTPYCLLGLASTVSYLALGILSLCKLYLMGFAAMQNGNATPRGVTEGVMLMLLSLQMGLLDMKILQRTALLSLIFFIVVTSTLQSMIEIADPIVLALAATGNRNVWKHGRGLSVCLFLLAFPSFMAYKIVYFFPMDFWLLILVSSCLLTSLQVLGTLFIYSLFMIKLLQDSQVERMDEIINGVNAISRVLEVLVVVCVVVYGSWESYFGEWNWMGVSGIMVHSYFNLWLRGQYDLSSFLQRREVARKISHLPSATEEQLRAHDDVCSICFQDMLVAVITSCGHFFHADCLKKWLYVQDTCPLCHQLATATVIHGVGGERQDSNSEDEIREGRMYPEGEDGVQTEESSMEAPQTEDYGIRADTGVCAAENCSSEEDIPSLEMECGYFKESGDFSQREMEDQKEVEQKEEILHRQELMALCREKQELLLCKRIVQDPCSKSEEDADEDSYIKKQKVKIPSNDWKEVLSRKDVVPTLRAVQVLYGELEEVTEAFPYIGEQKEDLPGRERVDVVHTVKGVQVPYREAEGIPFTDEKKEEMSCKESQAMAICRTAVQVCYTEGEVSEEVPSTEVPQKEVVSMEAEDPQFWMNMAGGEFVGK
ncbi:RING finger protein 145-like [Hyperolius riggenbachi]|uniref:RING finger protein 145-like n=1 Tax=Hyperolius riggenbachi TaxID=752182 RepID=UPI0035A2623E